MTDAARPMTADARGTRPRQAFGVSFWLLLMIAEAVVMLQVARLAMGFAQDMRYGIAAGLLILGTAICGFAIFAVWRRQNTAMQLRLAEERATAMAREAEAAAQAQQKSRQLATMSHEIRTPLNGVIGMLGLLLETDMNGEQRNYASIAHGSARSLLSVLDEILDTAKAESKTHTQTEISPLIETVAELMAPRAHSKGIDISSYVSPSVPEYVPFNGLHLRQILFNLAGNAIKFTAQGGVALDANCDAGRLIITVSDSGIGMTDEEASRVFAEFEQATGETQRRFGGTGLGLSISRRLADAMGGSLTVRSARGQGTTFILSLPLADSTAAKHDTPLAGRSYGLWVAPSYGAEHLAKKLKDFGATIAFPGEAAIDSCHAIICDPTEARNLITLRRATSDISTKPLWVLLNPEERRSVKSILDEPSTGYLVKPLRTSTLLAMLTAQDQSAVETGAKELRHVAVRAQQRKTKTPGLKLLLADDSPVNLLLATTLLRRAGHDVITAGNGQDALAALAASDGFDAVLLDVEMPGMDGHETTRRIRAMGHDTLPILALTGSVSPDDVRAGKDAGMNGHLAKPFDKEDLDAALATLIRNRAA